MDNAVKEHLTQIFVRYNFDQPDAEFISSVIEQTDNRQRGMFSESKEFFLSKDDKVELLDKLSNNRTELLDKIHALETNMLDRFNKMDNRISQVETNLTNKLNTTLSWSLSITIAILGSLMALFKFL